MRPGNVITALVAAMLVLGLLHALGLGLPLLMVLAVLVLLATARAPGPVQPR